MFYKPYTKVYINFNRFIIGNMSSPTINRLGKTQLWYKNYYSDFTYIRMYKIINTFESLITKYFNYGLHFTNNIFYNKFWYKKFSKINNHTLFNEKKSTLYLRKHHYLHKILTIKHSYSLRLKAAEFFPLRLYVINYNNWIISSVQWFKPLKKLLYKNTKTKNNLNLKTYNTINTFNKRKASVQGLYRVKIFLFFLKNYLKTFLPKKLYIF